MVNERSPLIQRVPVAEPRQRYPHQWLRRTCTAILVAAVVTVPLVFFLAPGLHTKLGRHHHDTSQASRATMPGSWPKSSGMDYKELQYILSNTPKEASAREWSKYYTSGPHLMGKNLSQAEWTRDRWQEFGVLNSQVVSYEVYANYPKDHRLALLDTGKEDHPRVLYEASLEEDVLEEDHTTGLKDRVPTFHGYSASGNVTAQFVYCNHGTFFDFDEVQKAGVELKGKIALVRYGGVFRGLKVKRAQELGMVGVVMYSDPGDDPVQEHDPEKQYPKGPARNPSSVQRGSAQFLSNRPGDPTTPGYPSKPGVPRTDTDDSIPQIPSLPISYAEALPLLKALNGHGPKASTLSARWHTGGLGYKGIKYNLGPSPKGIELNLYNEQEYIYTPIWNVIGIINGSIPDEVVVLGNHRDAWIAGGAADPNSGSAALNEVIRSFGSALAAGWQPMRTIVFASWDGEEYGLVGSTEWVEEYLPWLSASAIAYLNVDVGTKGPDFRANSAPLLNGALLEATGMVQSPNQTVKGQTVRDTWDEYIGTMGSGSDFTAFQDFAGIASVDLGFGENPSAAQKEGTPVYHYHSNYDSFDWMERFGDPGWHYHIAIAKVWALMAAHLVESPVAQLNASEYARALHKYATKVEDMLPEGVSLKKLNHAISKFTESAEAFDDTAQKMAERLASDLPWWRPWLRAQLFESSTRLNSGYKNLDKQFLYAKGLDKRPWFKHSIFAPGRWTGYAGDTFPGLVESVQDGEMDNFYRWQRIIAGQVYDAARLLDNSRRS